MIITLIGADFSKSNIGTLSSWIISRVLGDGATYAGPLYVDKDAALNATVTLDEGYEIGSDGITITMGGTVLDESYYSIVDNVITFTIDSVTGSVVIKVPTLNTNVPNYTFTINPIPTDATVTLSATGYPDVSGTGSQSITVADGIIVNWSVSADGYAEQNGTWTANGIDENKAVTLLGEAYWVGEKLSGKAHGTGTASSYLGTQLYYITDEAAISELSEKPIDKMAFNFASKSGADTPAGTITVYLVNLNNSTPANWEAKAEIPVESYTAGSQKEFDITPFVVPAGYTIGYKASKTNILGGGYMMQDYKIGGAYYESEDATSSKDAALGGVDVHIQGV